MPTKAEVFVGPLNAGLAEWWAACSLELCDELNQHLQTLEWFFLPATGSPRPDGLPIFQYATGFAFKEQDRVWWITAGHLLKSLEQQSKCGNVLGARLMDCPCRSRPMEGGVVLPLEVRRQNWIDCDTKGLDVGAIELGMQEVECLKRRSLKVVHLRMLSEEPADFEVCVILGSIGVGLAEDKVPGIPAPSHVRRMIFPMIPVTPIASEPDWETEVPRFHFRILYEIGAYDRKLIHNDVAGMSGGPVFGLRRRGNGVEYRLIGVQSSQRNHSQHGRVLHVSRIADYLTAIVNEEVNMKLLTQ